MNVEVFTGWNVLMSAPYFKMFQENKMYGWVEGLKRSVMKQTQQNVHGKI